MKPLILTSCDLARYMHHLACEERSPATIQSYHRALGRFLAWQGQRPVDKTALLRWKAALITRYAPASVNAQLAALNGFFAHLGRPDLRLRYERVQRRLFRDPARELTQRDYERLHASARRTSSERALLLETLAATGIRVSELSHITVQAVQAGRAEIHLKGKIRVILLAPLCANALLVSPGQKRSPMARSFAPQAVVRSAGIRSGPV